MNAVAENIDEAVVTITVAELETIIRRVVREEIWITIVCDAAEMEVVNEC